MNIVILLGTALLTGCMTTGNVAMTVNDAEGYTVQRTMRQWCAPGIVSPSQCIATLSDLRPDTGKETTTYVTNAATGGWLPSVIGGASAVGSAHLIGRGLRDSGSGDSTVEVHAVSGSASSAQQQ